MKKTYILCAWYDHNICTVYYGGSISEELVTSLVSFRFQKNELKLVKKEATSFGIVNTPEPLFSEILLQNFHMTHAPEHAKAYVVSTRDNTVHCFLDGKFHFEGRIKSSDFGQLGKFLAKQYKLSHVKYLP